MKNLWSLIIFSSPKISILTDMNDLRQNAVQWPIIFPPIKTIKLGNSKAGKNIIEIRIIPEKKIVKNKKCLNIILEFYNNSDSFCLFWITLIFDLLIIISIGLGLKL